MKVDKEIIELEEELSTKIEIKKHLDSLIEKSKSPPRLSKSALIVEKTIDKLEKRLGKFIPVEELEKELANKLNQKQITNGIDGLLNTAILFEPRKGFIQKI